MLTVKTRAWVAVIAILISSLAALWIWKEKFAMPPVSVNQNWIKLIDKVKTAKRVTTVATFEESLSDKRILKNVERPEDGFIVLEVKNREALYSFLQRAEGGDPMAVAACFCPHHFVVIDEIVIALCFGCGGLSASRGKEDIFSGHVSPVPDRSLQSVFGLGRAPDNGEYVRCGIYNESEEE